MASTDKTVKPSYVDLLNIANDLNEYSKSLPKFIASINNIAKSVSEINKIDADNLKRDMENTVKITKVLNSTIGCLEVAMNDLKSLTNKINIADADKITEVLMSREFMDNPGKYMSTTDKEGNRIEFLKTTKPGLLDVFAQVAGMGTVMNSMVFVNPIKFRLKFRQTLRLFKSQYDALLKYTSSVGGNDIKILHQALNGLQEVMMFLPVTTGQMADMFSSYGKITKRLQIKRGIKTLIGDNLSLIHI